MGEGGYAHFQAVPDNQDPGFRRGDRYEAVKANTGDARGFTLLELLVAMAIFAVLSVIAYSGVKAMVATRQQVEQEAERLGSLQRAVSRVCRDFAQAAARPVRDEFGLVQPAFIGEPGRKEGLEFTRGGWRNPAARPRSHFQRVAYRFAEGELLRDAWPVLDRAPGQEPYTEALLDKVAGFQVRFLDSKGEWRDSWPPAESAPEARPRAVEITLELEDWGRIQRLVPLDPDNSYGNPS